MDYYNERCYGSQKTSIKRCRNYVVNSNHLCNIHFNEVKKNKKLILYNGSVADYDSKNSLKSLTPSIKTWRDLNKKLSEKKINMKKKEK